MKSGIISTALLLFAAFSTAATGGESMDSQLREQARRSVDRGLHFLREQEAEDGSWSNSVGMTALGLRAFLNSHRGYKESDGAFITRPLQFILSKANEDGSLSESLQNRSYNTALALTAIAATKNPKYDGVIAKGQAFLKKHAVDEGEGYDRTHPYYGGIGYGGDERPDLSNQFFSLQALRATSLDPKDPVWEKAILFVSRSQNRSESNDQLWSGNDGGFIYMPGGNIEPFKGTESYGTMTVVGMISLLYAGMDKTDPRVQAGYEWFRKHYTLDTVPGTDLKDGIFYYYFAFAHCMAAFGEAEIVDTDGKRHNWRNDLAQKLLSLQDPDGSWVNKDSPRWWQNNPQLVTAFSVNALNMALK
jgi:squalene-hopene/tetraprenyl-beta-curcumene cyclase